MNVPIDDAYADEVYAELKAELADKLSDFDGDVAFLAEHGERDGAIYFGLLTAADESVPVSQHLIDRARPLFGGDEVRPGFDYAVEQLAHLAGQ